MNSTVAISLLWHELSMLCCLQLKKGSFYIAQYPVRYRSKRFTLFASPGRPVHSDTNSASPGSILARQQLRAKAKSLAFPPLSIARYSFIQLSEQGRQWRERKCPIFETITKRDSNLGSLDCESGILPLSYRLTWLAYGDGRKRENSCLKILHYCCIRSRRSVQFGCYVT